MHINAKNSEAERSEIVFVEGGKIYVNDENDFSFCLGELSCYTLQVYSTGAYISIS